jgi:hypothetical protein
MRFGAAIFAAFIAFAVATGEAHKPITSPFTFNEDVFPILQAHCGRCHVAGGVAPMSLMTHGETVPWGESLRLELIAGHMPPWAAQTSAGRLRHAASPSARELNTLLTWASGGTPIGDESRAPAPVVLEHGWRLGTPDLVLPLPEFTLSTSAQEQVAEFVVRAPASARALRAIDLMPGTPAMVRSATVSLRSNVGAAFPSAPLGTGRRPDLLLWQPGDEPVALDGAAFDLPANAELVVRIRYKKTWEYERTAMTDRSTIGLYLAPAALPAVQRLDVTLPGIVIDRGMRVLAIAPEPGLADADVRVETIAPDGARSTLIALRPAGGWTRRFWFETPVVLPAGTRVGVSTSSMSAARPTLMLDVLPL